MGVGEARGWRQKNATAMQRAYQHAANHPRAQRTKDAGRALERLAFIPSGLRLQQKKFRSKDTPRAYTLVHRPCPGPPSILASSLLGITLLPISSGRLHGNRLTGPLNSSKKGISNKCCLGFAGQTIQKQNVSLRAAAKTGACLFPFPQAPRAHT